MQSFRDGANRDWRIEINVGTIKRVKALTGIDLPGLFDDGQRPLAGLLSNFVVLVDVLYAVLKEQCDRAGVSDEEFGRSMYGDQLGKAAEALVEGLIDFFPQAKTRHLLSHVMKRGKEIAEVRYQQVMEEIDSQTEKMKRATLYGPPTTPLEEPSGDTSGNLLESSVSTQSPGPGAS